MPSFIAVVKEGGGTDVKSVNTNAKAKTAANCE